MVNECNLLHLAIAKQVTKPQHYVKVCILAGVPQCPPHAVAGAFPYCPLASATRRVTVAPNLRTSPGHTPTAPWLRTRAGLSEARRQNIQYHCCLYIYVNLQETYIECFNVKKPFTENILASMTDHDMHATWKYMNWSLPVLQIYLTNNTIYFL